jgi:hypothetical protein
MTSEAPREFDLYKNKSLLSEVYRVYNDSKSDENEKILENVNPEFGKSVDEFTATTKGGSKVPITDIKKLLNARTKVTYKYLGNERYIALWYPLNKLEQIQTEKFNLMLDHAIKQNSETKKKLDKDFYSGYDSNKLPMTVVHHPYEKVQGETQYVDIEITFNFPKTYANTIDDSTRIENRIIIRFIQNFRHLMTEELDAEKLQTLQNSILEFKCSAMRSAMTQEGGTCFINAAFNVIRLSPDFSKLIELKTQNTTRKTQHFVRNGEILPEKCKSINPTACEETMDQMADVRNKRRHLGETICKMDGGAYKTVMKSICDTYGISLASEYKNNVNSDVVMSRNIAVNDIRYKLVGSLLAGDAHVVCGYFCTTTTGITPQARVFDSNGYDIAHDWVPESDEFDVFNICKSVFAKLKKESAKVPGDMGNYAVMSSATISLIYILVDSLRPTQTKT